MIASLMWLLLQVVYLGTYLIWGVRELSYGLARCRPKKSKEPFRASNERESKQDDGWGWTHYCYGTVLYQLLYLSSSDQGELGPGQGTPLVVQETLAHRQGCRCNDAGLPHRSAGS